MIEANPADGIRAGADQPREARFLTPSELAAAALAAAAGPHAPDQHDVVTHGPHGRATAMVGSVRDTAIVWLLGTTGLRIGELCALDVGDVTLARRRLRVRTSKNGTARDVPIPGPVLARLDLDGRAQDEPLFGGADGGG